MNAPKTVTGVAIAGFALALSSAALAQESLVDQVRDGKRESVLAAITSPEVDVNAAAPDGSTALHWATYQVDHELVRALLDAGAVADVSNEFGSTPLTEAIKLGDLELVQMLLDAGADPDSPNADNQTMLMLASNIGLLEIAELRENRGHAFLRFQHGHVQRLILLARLGEFPARSRLQPRVLHRFQLFLPLFKEI
jgi:ankyrin repeat protein